jgi:hypothetical protein
MKKLLTLEKVNLREIWKYEAPLFIPKNNLLSLGIIFSKNS